MSIDEMTQSLHAEIMEQVEEVAKELIEELFGAPLDQDIQRRAYENLDPEWDAKFVTRFHQMDETAPCIYHEWMRKQAILHGRRQTNASEF